MYSALSWVPRGVAREKLLPAAPGASSDAAATAAAAAGATAASGAAGPSSSPANAASGSDSGGDAGSDAGSVDMAEVLAGDLDSLALYASNRDDPYLAHDDDACAQFDAEELDDLRVRPTDALVVAAKGGDDASVLEVYLLEDDADASDDDSPYQPHFYVHHDVVLPTLPLCTAVTSLPPRADVADPADPASVRSTPLNLVAVGCFTPGIDVWDVDLVNVLEPAAVLGGYEEQDEDAPGAPTRAVKTAGARRAKKGSSKKKKKRPKLRLKEGSHSDAVMSLSWNAVQPEYLASGSADTTVKIWDVESAHCARTLTHHSGKVQAVAWHPADEASLLTGAFDGSVRIVDVRAQESPAHTTFAVRADVESAQWGTAVTFPGRVVAATEDGMVAVFDPHAPAAPALQWSAHEAAVSACVLSADVPGLVVTCSVDKRIRVWDARGCDSGSAKPRLVHEARSRGGAVFSAALCPCNGRAEASPFALAYAGAKGVLVVCDLAVESDNVRKTFAGATPGPAASVIAKRATRVKRVEPKTPGTQPVGRRSAASMADVGENSDSDSDASGGRSDSDSEYDTE